jgi:hypothetical protein
LGPAQGFKGQIKHAFVKKEKEKNGLCLALNNALYGKAGCKSIHMFV